MKKFLLVLGMVTCMVIGMTGCGDKAQELDLPTGMTEDQLIQYADQLVDGMRTVVGSGMQEQYAGDAVIYAALGSWESALPDMGDYIEIKGHELEQDDDTFTVNVDVQGSLRPAVVEVVLDQDFIVTSITTNVSYTFGELMGKAALNTILGMGTVFAVLILISLIISLFGYIPKIQESMKNKKKTQEPVQQTIAPDTAAAQVMEEEEPADDLELVAVIAAAVAASEGAVSTDGYVVRSIRRIR